MSVYEFIQMCIEPGFLNVCIYDTESGQNIYEGEAEEVPTDMEDLTVESYDVPTEGKLTLNVSRDI